MARTSTRCWKPAGAVFSQVAVVTSDMATVTQNGHKLKVVDADALNLSVQHRAVLHLPPSTILTPHPGEMARLADVTIAEVQAHREETAQGYAHKHQQVVVLKVMPMNSL